MEESIDGVSESAVQAARELRVVVSRLRRRLREVYETRELTPSQTAVLSRLDKGGPASTSDLAAAERVRPQSMASILTGLDKLGLIERRADPDDGRRQLVSPSRAGHELLDDGRRAGSEWLTRAMEDRLDEAERRTVIEAMALLERLVTP
ncbi:MarR family winged helix-turn-helix transcriptional regulator [Streptacidiphilus albus]|uniref:MarR family winged helix-turn-helix transcriptional regulator n=1 Tax=Streptacidiphilus albus TaxID=105425 RepID=UPI00054B4A34|nr:MarR family transcriptional regulator [Streptacidiphilus albus]